MFRFPQLRRAIGAIGSMDAVIALAIDRWMFELDLWLAICGLIEEDQVHDFMEPSYGSFDTGGGD